MPRPPAKRNRLSPKATNKDNKPAINEANAQNIKEKDVSEAGVTAETPDLTGSQTPLSKVFRQGVEPSSSKQHIEASSRPPSRPRGYSATLSLAARKGDGNSRVPGTPGFDSSILSNFRRRPRQHSILQMMQAEDGSSELDDDDDFLGSLTPEAESTPLNQPWIKETLVNPSAVSPKSPSNSIRRGDDTPEGFQEPQSPSVIASGLRDRSITPRILGNGLNAPMASPELAEYTDSPSQTMAPPLSSSVVSSPQKTVEAVNHEESPSKGDRGGRKPRNKKNPTSTQTSHHLSTASLQEKFLPRRHHSRRRRRGENDGISGESSDDLSDSTEVDGDDELSYMPSKPHRSRVDRQNKTRAYARPKLKKTDKENRKIGGKGVENREQTVLRTKITYASRDAVETGPDKENQEVDDSSPLSSLSSTPDPDAIEPIMRPSPTDVYPKTFISKELEIQAKKFMEVDEWEMDFEDVASVEGQDASAR
ncbi:hypothetical protein ASPZODRAFT_162427 [Penicilliopsis zonata CBS 506.65]|uniref:Uncharacterized protein n=1 Tax=Penicilliopsis zonata CBS 506.65 TaxID=1073090 RepID=A0A1L9STN3_9EURO|nr:hypothetical protein ASPZODRAFT_162427 [Penicilliopsis zonata CBS 506.65]OJJ50447.1 hypothetical protein ASPZODRAFT_162427 [Penicilliopsis zonata CBS 506.65]